MAERLKTVDEIVAVCVVSNPVKQNLRRVRFNCVIFAVIGIWIPGWPTVSWAVPAGFPILSIE